MPRSTLANPPLVELDPFSPSETLQHTHGDWLGPIVDDDMSIRVFGCELVHSPDTEFNKFRSVMIDSYNSNWLHIMVGGSGFEPPTSGLSDQRSHRAELPALILQRSDATQYLKTDPSILYN